MSLTFPELVFVCKDFGLVGAGMNMARIPDILVVTKITRECITFLPCTGCSAAPVTG